MSKRKRSEESESDSKDINIFTFDSLHSLQDIENYICSIREYQKEIDEIIKKKRDNNLKDSDDEIKEINKKIKNLEHNVRYNLFHINKINNILLNIKSELKTNVEDLCDHDIYSECEYHNDRYYYCKKCTYER